jgi:hypothetical protein
VTEAGEAAMGAKREDGGWRMEYTESQIKNGRGELQNYSIETSKLINKV